jgi:5'-methylthioadenosine phosphorylase
MNKKNITKIGIIGGSGLDDPKILKNSSLKSVKTPYGSPAGPLTLGKIGRTSVVVISRHGKKHNISPTQVPFQANIWALKKENCTHIIATTACGSLRETIKPGDLVFPDQFIDFTRLRPLSFHTKKVVHTPMADPFDKGLRDKLIVNAKKLKLNFHPKGTLVTIEGPRFSTRAESNLFRSWKADLVNMTTVPEVVLANEVDIAYQPIAMSTDYDCWKENEKPVTFEIILKIMEQNGSKVKKLLVETIANF